ncbi:MAG: ABC transporter ATP-binding protein/permease [Acidimicrobiia bacterium]|nr:ABC transporter ATP-binding protein/permease [Acidimicrobiia bacterium]MDH5421217.1 ABC transporter ATP-binding protein/permease [Acidimicrobiia bacterium]MDH5502682.1 ABC transporter ATP-binding protein/permease [Acidimicrobiia bacterium]
MYARFGSGEGRTEGTWELLRKAASYGKGLGWVATGALFATILATVARLAGPAYVRQGLDAVDVADRQALFQSVWWFVGALVLQYISQAISQYWVSGVGERYLADLRVRAFRHLIDLDVDFFSRSKAGVLVSRLTSDIEALTQFVKEGAINVVTSILTVIGVTIAMFLIDTSMALAVLALMPILLGVSVVFRIYADRAYEQVREHIGRVLGAIQEGISGVRVVQAYTQEHRQKLEFGRVNERYFDANIAAAKAISAYFPAVDFLRTSGLALILVVGGNRVLDGEMSFGALVAFLLYLNWFFEPIVQISNLYNLLQAALAALSKLLGILDREAAVPEAIDPVPLPEIVGKLTFDRVTFGYDPAVPILHGIDLEIQAGERIAIVGETGSGKSTLAKLAVRFYDPLGGTISLDEVDLVSIGFEDLRRGVALVPQEGFLFAGTLRDNIRYARPDAGDDEIWNVCATLGIAEWVGTLPDLLDTEVRERGSRFSSGERQLVALARALLAGPSVIVMDEATSNLDPETEGVVEAALATLLEGRTAIVIAHRLATAERADRVVVMDDGRIVEIGHHSELVGAAGPYARLSEVWQAAQTSD